jgi:hypothetical protein
MSAQGRKVRSANSFCLIVAFACSVVLLLCRATAIGAFAGDPRNNFDAILLQEVWGSNITALEQPLLQKYLVAPGVRRTSAVGFVELVRLLAP